jgi:hypothetical protein
VSAQKNPLFTSPLPTDVRLDPAGEAVDLGSLPINLVLTPQKDRAVVVLSGWREQGVQVVDLKTRKVTQTLLQDGAFYAPPFLRTAIAFASQAATPTWSSSMRGKTVPLRSKTNSNWRRQKRRTARAQAIRQD